VSEIRNRIKKNVSGLEAWAKKFKIDAYRIYERDIPDYPFIVDRYNDKFVVYDRSIDAIDSREDKQLHFPRLIAALKELFGASDDQIIVKRRSRQKGEMQYEKIDESNRTETVREGDALFKVNLYDYLDTGLFLDHRLMREKIRKQSQGKEVLNLFCYTGSVSVFAALGGGRVTSVDMSATYSRWAQDNFRLNGLDPSRHVFVTQNALEYLGESHRERFDIVFLDPPTFSNSKKMESSFEVERDQTFLVESCMKLLKPGGVLYFSNNKRSFKLEPALQETFSVRDITTSTIPKDFRDSKIHRVYEIRAKTT
jgi:23S rRNA (cytosine1962-C5)-methyltransferase/23S rRNA (guanine2445-N2)-methyltransferase / 23S rRNA (guanine2069-N7)-methyltransferase